MMSTNKQSINFLQSKIEEKASERLNKDLKEARDLLLKNPILSRLEIEVKSKEGEEYGIFLVGDTSNSKSFFSEYGYRALSEETCLEFTNMEEIKYNLLKKYIKEEGDEMLEKLNLLKEYIS